MCETVYEIKNLFSKIKDKQHSKKDILKNIFSIVLLVIFILAYTINYCFYTINKYFDTNTLLPINIFPMICSTCAVIIILLNIRPMN